MVINEMVEIIFRIIFFIVLVTVFAISGTFRRRARSTGDVIERKEEGAAVLALRMVLALPLLITLILYVVYPSALIWAQVDIPIWLRIGGAVIAVLCIPLIYWVFVHIGRNISETVLTKDDHDLITSGPYKWIRHPLYSFAILLLISLSLMAANLFLFLYSLLAFLVFRFFVIPEEEKRLIGAFGDQYRNYQLGTGAMVPKVF